MPLYICHSLSPACHALVRQILSAYILVYKPAAAAPVARWRCDASATQAATPLRFPVRISPPKQAGQLFASEVLSLFLARRHGPWIIRCRWLVTFTSASYGPLDVSVVLLCRPSQCTALAQVGYCVDLFSRRNEGFRLLSGGSHLSSLQRRAHHESTPRGLDAHVYTNATSTAPSLYSYFAVIMHSRGCPFLQVAASFFEYRQSPENAFAERFKYDVISSSLLSSAIAPTPTIRRTFGTDLPGKLDDASDGSLSDGDKSPTLTSPPLSEFQVPAALVAVAAIALAAEYYFVAIFLMLAATYSWHSLKASAERATTTASVRSAPSTFS